MSSRRSSGKPTIVAIGGGELKDRETLPIDREIVRLAGKKHPRALFIPTASGDPEGYVESFEEIYGTLLGCRVDSLLVAHQSPRYEEIEEKILSADLIYVGGGNTLKMMRRWRKLGVDRALGKAHQQGVVLSGLSAGAICWFRYGTSDSRRFYDPDDLTLIRVRGLGLIDAVVSPHHLREPHRREGLIDVMRRTPGVGLALDDCAAIAIEGDRYRVITSAPDATVHTVFRQGGEISYERLDPVDGTFEELVSKDR